MMAEQIREFYLEQAKIYSEQVVFWAQELAKDELRLIRFEGIDAEYAEDIKIDIKHDRKSYNNAKRMYKKMLKKCDELLV